MCVCVCVCVCARARVCMCLAARHAYTDACSRCVVYLLVTFIYYGCLFASHTVRLKKSQFLKNSHCLKMSYFSLQSRLQVAWPIYQRRNSFIVIWQHVTAWWIKTFVLKLEVWSRNHYTYISVKWLTEFYRFWFNT